VEEPCDENLVGGIDGGQGAAAREGRCEHGREGGELLLVEAAKLETPERRDIETRKTRVDAFGIRQRVLDRNPHVTSRRLGQDRSIAELDERVNDGFRVDHGGNPVVGHIE
jgi:hypothetical protein